ncbi:hypothetical protein INR75_06815 [Zunongwangia sp. SCSIO 43204]|uniref:hypothetical protein n=1 Tax=Zunongwangia sp. SCSIO 43204 TaxID=2779359 RepID=UPI001CA9E93D|nr:hypothetical protein [Zunongwangia sp. SCSIO 43204]UAB85719.1 hypothetical protein INR75_06815 [Zunongwangia sp. SCSIO 43204]
MSKLERIEKAVAYLKGKQIITKQQDIVDKMNVNKSSVSSALKGNDKYLTDSFIEKFSEAFGLNSTWILTGKGSLKDSNNEEPEFQPEGKIIDDSDKPEKEVIVIPVKGRGGLENAFYDDLALKKMETEKLSIKYPSSNGSKWFKIEVEGVSMDDSTADFEGSKYSLVEGDWVYCRSIPKIHWRNKLHIESVKVFCFFHNTRGIIFKKVRSHNTETGELELYSLNKDKKRFPDFKINVSECSYICNVLRVMSDF